MLILCAGVAPGKNSTFSYLVVLIKCIISFQLFSDLALFIHTDQTNLTPNCVAFAWRLAK